MDASTCSVKNVLIETLKQERELVLYVGRSSVRMMSVKFIGVKEMTSDASLSNLIT